MPFASFVVKEELKGRGREALDLQLPFDEATMLEELGFIIRKQLGIPEITIADAVEEDPRDTTKKAANAVPGKPQIIFVSEGDAPAPKASPKAAPKESPKKESKPAKPPKEEKKPK